MEDVEVDVFVELTPPVAPPEDVDVDVFVELIPPVEAPAAASARSVVSAGISDVAGETSVLVVDGAGKPWCFVAAVAAAPVAAAAVAHTDGEGLTPAAASAEFCCPVIGDRGLSPIRPKPESAELARLMLLPLVSRPRSGDPMLPRRLAAGDSDLARFTTL